MNTLITFLTSEKGKGIIRHVLTFVGGVLVAKGALSQTVLDTLIAQSETVVAAVGALVSAGAVVMSVKQKNTP